MPRKKRKLSGWSGWSSRCKVPAICRDKIDGKTLLDFITKANDGLRPPYEVVLFAKPDVDPLAVLTPSSDPAEFDSVSHKASKTHHGSDFSSFSSFHTKCEYGLSKDGDKMRTTDLAAIQLDEPAARRDGLCYVCVATDTRDTEPSLNESSIGFRCAFKDVPAVLAELDDLGTSWRREESVLLLRNEAAMCGGVWSTEAIASIRANEASNSNVLRCHLDPVGFPPSKGRPSAGQRRRNPFLYPVYITAGNVSLRTINEMLKSYHDGQMRHSTDDSAGPSDLLCIVTNVDPTTTSAANTPDMGPLETLPILPRELLHASPEACMAFSRCRLPAQPDLLLQQNEFVIVDDLTETDKTVIFGSFGGSWAFHNLLTLGRVSIDYLWDVHCITRMTAMSYGYQADKASRRVDGVLRSFAA